MVYWGKTKLIDGTAIVVEGPHTTPGELTRGEKSAFKLGGLESAYSNRSVEFTTNLLELTIKENG